MKRVLCSLFTGLSAVTLIQAQGSPPGQPPQLEIPRVSIPPKVDDFLNGTHRGSAEVTDFRQREPGDGVPASQKTSAYLSYDDANLYVAFVCRDEPGKVRAHMAKREAVAGDDRVGVILDTFHDRRRAYFFITNPLGIQVDGITAEGQQDDITFDTLWHSEGRLTSNGYVVLIAIPFKSLRFTNEANQTWGIALTRTIERNNENVFWPSISRRIQSFIQQMATLKALANVSPGRNLQVIPYGTFAAARFLDREAPQFTTDSEARAGVDAKMILRDALTIDLTLNPDFSQVESDEPQVTINRRFEVFFPEKRPFFIENASFFRTPQELFFSRRIVDPRGGLRLTGKIGRWAVAGLATDDRAAGQGFPESHPLSEDSAQIGVFRLQREFRQQSSVGVLMTSRDFGSGSNRVFAVDTRLRLSPNWSFTGQAIGSDTRELSGRRPSGPAYLADIRYNSRKFNYRSSYSDISPDFRTQLGFVPRVDIRQNQNVVSYTWFPEKRGIVSTLALISTLASWDRTGSLQDWHVNGQFDVELRGQTRFGLLRRNEFELFRGQGFRKDSTEFFFTTQWLKWLTILALYKKGADINFFPAGHLQPFLGDSTFAFLQLTIRPTPRLRFDQTYVHSRLHARRGSALPQVPESAAIFNNHLFRWRLNYQFTRELSLRAIVDYNAVLPNSSLVALQRDKRINGDILFTYLVNPWTALYVGYSDRFENLTIDPLTSSLARTDSPSTHTGRQLFVKLSYLFRF